MHGKRIKKNVYIPLEMFEQLTVECKRLDRSMSWVVEQSLKISLPRIREGLTVKDGSITRGRCPPTCDCYECTEAQRLYVATLNVNCPRRLDG